MRNPGEIAKILIFLPFTAFSRETRRIIGQRDHWTCLTCGKAFRDGWMVTAAHYDHRRDSQNYDDPQNGRILCIRCHAQNELDAGYPDFAELLLQGFGLYTEEYLAKSGKRQVYLSLRDLH